MNTFRQLRLLRTIFNDDPSSCGVISIRIDNTNKLTNRTLFAYTIKISRKVNLTSVESCQQTFAHSFPAQTHIAT